MRKAVETRLALVIRPHDMPGCVRSVGCVEHQVPRMRIVIPLLTRRQVHWTEFPLTQWILNASLEAPLLFLITHFEPVFDQNNPAINDELFDHRAEFEKPVALFLGTKTHDILNPGAVVPTAVKDDHLAGCGEVRKVALNIHLTL